MNLPAPTRLFQLAIISGVMSSACGFPRPVDLPENSGGDADAGDFALALDTSRVHLRDGATAAVGIRLMRNEAPEPVTVTVAALPTGVTADPLTIDADAGRLILHSAPDATQGEATLIITAIGATHSHDVNLSLLAMGPPGTADESFGASGTSDLGFGHGQDVALQSDGKILLSEVVGASGTALKFAVARYLPNGTADASFSGGNVLLEEAPDVTTRANVAVQPDGKIVVISTSGQSNAQATVTRLNSDGTFDDSFGSGGNRTFAVGAAQFTELMAVVVEPDNRIVLGGDADRQAFIARLDASGMFDPTFNTTGVTIPAGLAPPAQFLALALQPDGRIVASGSATQGSTTVTSFARFDVTGHLDASFRGSGSVIIDLDTGNNFQNSASVALQQDAKIVAAGGTGNLNPGNGSLVRLLGSDGSLDVTFGIKGAASLAVGQPAFISSMVLQPDGKFIVAGSVQMNGVQKALLARFNADTQLDQSFGNKGWLIGADASEFRKATLDADGRIVVTGFRIDAQDQIILSRFWP